MTLTLGVLVMGMNHGMMAATPAVRRRHQVAVLDLMLLAGSSSAASATVRPLFRIQEGFGERIVFDLQRRHLKESHLEKARIV